MYKLFLCLRYLRLKFIAYLPMAAVALCVAMMLIAASVMNGFLHKIEIAARGLYGDIVMEPTSLSGMAYYDEFAARIKKELPAMHLPGVRPLKADEIKTSPFIYTGGILDTAYSDNRQMVQVAGIRLPERVEVSSFGDGLFFQKGLKAPSFDPPFATIEDRVGEALAQTRQVLDKQQAASRSANDPPEHESLIRRLDTADYILRVGQSRLARAAAYQKEMADLQRQIDAAEDKPGSMSDQKLDQLREKLLELCKQTDVQAPDNRVILGLGLPGLTFRTQQGQTIRSIGPGETITLTLLPLGRRSVSMQDIKPVRDEFTIVDDCRTDVNPVDANTIYLPFETLQRINNMGPQYTTDGRRIAPRCSQLHIKLWRQTPKGLVPDEGMGEEQLERIAVAIDTLWQKFTAEHPDTTPLQTSMTVQTWQQRQVALISQIASQRTLVVIMFGIISMVSVVLIFVIFYMIVLQKTKDIGVVKALGGSGGGVAAIFLGYGSAVGLVGAMAGVLGGALFVHYINPIHDWVGRTTGLVVWNREWLMFEKIPNEVEPLVAALILAGAVLAGLVGSLLPAILAARKQPVEALRYE